MSAFDPEASFAILFGVAAYKNETFDSMPWVANNLTALKSVLTDQELVGFRDDHVVISLNPTNGRLGGELNSRRKKSPDIDTLLVYYCGHGVVQRGTYFLTGEDAGETEAEKLNFETFENIFLSVKAKRKILVLDSCFSARAIGHLSESTNILEANVERLAAKEKSTVELDSSRKGTYVVASADRDKPARSSDESGELTAFTSLFVRRLRIGLAHRVDERLTINDIIEAVKVEAAQQELPEPVTSDKSNLGAWPLIGNAAVVKATKLRAAIADDIKEQVLSTLREFENKVLATVALGTDALQKGVSQIPSLIARIDRLEETVESVLTRSHAGPPENPNTLQRPVTSNSHDFPSMISDAIAAIGNAFARARDALVRIWLFTIVVLAGPVHVAYQIASRPMDANSIFESKLTVTTAYAVAAVLLELANIRRRRMRGDFGYMGTVAGSVIFQLEFNLIRGVSMVGFQLLFWSLLIGCGVTWLVSRDFLHLFSALVG